MNFNKDIKFFRLKDIIILIVLLTVAVVMLFNLALQENKNITAVIVKDNKEIEKIELTKVLDNYQINIEGDIPVVISVEPGAIYFKESKCHDKICINHGKLSKVGEIAVCLPAKVSIEIRGNEKTFDSIMG